MIVIPWKIFASKLFICGTYELKVVLAFYSVHFTYLTNSCTPDRNCHTFCLGDKIASHPGVLTQAKKITQNLEINQILGVVVQEKESNMVFCSRWKFPTLGMTVLSGTSAEPRTEPHIRFLYSILTSNLRNRISPSLYF